MKTNLVTLEKDPKTYCIDVKLMRQNNMCDKLGI